MRPLERLLRRAAALALAALVATPEIALAVDSAAPAARSKSLDSMSQSEIDALVSDINHQANWRKFRRPSDPPDFEPGKPVKVMHGAGAVLGRGGQRGGRSFRQAGLSNRRSGKGRGNSRDASAMDRGRGSSRGSGSGSSFGSGSSSRSSFGSGSSLGSGSSFGSGSRSSFGSGSGFGSGNGFSNGM